MTLTLLSMDGLLVAYCFSFLAEIQSWSTIGMASRIMRQILESHPLAWKGACIDLSKKDIKESDCVIFQSMLKNASSIIISAGQLQFLRVWPGHYKMRWTARMPYCNPISGAVYPVSMRGYHGMFISHLPIIRGMTYNVIIDWVGYFPYFKMGISECRTPLNIRKCYIGFGEYDNFTTVVVHAHSHTCAPLYWTRDGMEYEWIEDSNPDILTNYDSSEGVTNQLCLGMQWNLDSVIFQFNTYRNTLITSLPRESRFYLFIDICPKSTATMRIHPKEIEFSVVEK